MTIEDLKAYQDMKRTVRVEFTLREFPDLDNLQKALQDVMTELGFFTDDCWIAQLQTSKIYTFHPGVSIVANTMKGNAYELE